jgi:hypothetical protein
MWRSEGGGTREAKRPTDLAAARPEPPTGGDAYTVLLDDVKLATERRAMDGTAFSFTFYINLIFYLLLIPGYAGEA